MFLVMKPTKSQTNKRGERIFPPGGDLLGGGADFAKYFAKDALPAGREKFPEISPVWGLEPDQAPQK